MQLLMIANLVASNGVKIISLPEFLYKNGNSWATMYDLWSIAKDLWDHGQIKCTSNGRLNTLDCPLQRKDSTLYDNELATRTHWEQLIHQMPLHECKQIITYVCRENTSWLLKGECAVLFMSSKATIQHQYYFSELRIANCELRIAKNCELRRIANCEELRIAKNCELRRIANCE